MTPVFQTIVGPVDAEAGKKGNCMQAVVASLFDLPLQEVPHFIEHNEEWFQVFYNFLDEQGYALKGYLYNGDKVLPEYSIAQNLHKMEGVNGYFYGVVDSPLFHETGGTHAVIVDKHGNIVHDPNPAYTKDQLYPRHDVIGLRGLKSVYLIEKKGTDDQEG